MRPPLAMSNGCAPVLASYSAITLFTSSMLAVAGSYSRSVVSPWDEKVRILAFMFGSCGTSIYGLLWNSSQRGLGPLRSYCTVSQSCQYTTGIPARILKNQTDVKNHKAGRNTSAWHRRCCAIVLRFACRVLRITERCVALMSWKRTSKTQSCATFPRGREFTWNGMDDIIDRTCGFSTRVEL